MLKEIQSREGRSEKQHLLALASVAQLVDFGSWSGHMSRLQV